jgi:hypothetical protein
MKVRGFHKRYLLIINFNQQLIQTTLTSNKSSNPQFSQP